MAERNAGGVGHRVGHRVAGRAGIIELGEVPAAASRASATTETTNRGTDNICERITQNERRTESAPTP